MFSWLTTSSSSAPVHPEHPDRRDCWPDVNGIIDAVNEGLGSGVDVSKNRSDGTPTSSVWEVIIEGSAQLAKDTYNAQKCMDQQDKKYNQDVEHYIDDVLNFTPAPPSNPTWSYDKYCEDRERSGNQLDTCGPNSDTCHDSGGKCVRDKDYTPSF